METRRWEVDVPPFRLFPDTAERFDSLVGLWLSMWGAAVNSLERSLSRRLIATLLPRTALDSPEIVVAAYRLIDGMELTF